MAGIGFQLRELANRGDILGATRAYGYSTFLVAGPWLFTVLALAGMTLALRPSTSWVEIQTFRSVIIYNFCLSLILTGPVVMLCTRYVADQIYGRSVRQIPFALAASLVAVIALSILIGVAFFGMAADLDPVMALLASANFALISAIWVTVPFLSIIEQYRSVALAFGAGALVAIGVSVAAAPWLDDRAILAVFNLALTVILSLVMRRLRSEYPGDLHREPAFLRFVRHHWELPLIGLLYYLGIWIDKLVLWQINQESVITVAGLIRTMPLYDSAMFKAQLLAIPVFVIFFVHVETRFFLLFRSLYDSFEAHATHRAVQVHMHRVARFVIERLLILLGAMLAIALVIVAMLPLIYETLGLRAIQTGMFRMGLVGTAFHTTFLLCLVFVLYFDLRRRALMLTLLFCVCNATFTLAFLPLGLGWYGAGYLLAAAIAVVAGVAVLFRELPWLAYHAFVTNNASIVRRPVAVTR